MLTLFFALLALVAAVALGRLPPRVRPADRATRRRQALVALLVLLPLLHSTFVLWGARERLRVLRFDYVGKQLTFSDATPVTAGGSSADAERVEDLNAGRLPPRSLSLVPLPVDKEAEEIQGAVALLRLTSPSPAVRVQSVEADRYLNSVPLEDGDEIVVSREGEEPVFLTYSGGAVHRGEERVALQGFLARVLGGGTRVYELAGLGGELGVPLPGVYSFLHHPRGGGAWHLLIRSSEVTVERGGQTVARFEAEYGVAARFRLSLGVVLNRSLRFQRRDDLRIQGDQVEVRFAEPRRRARTVKPEQRQVELALTVPSSYARREAIELPEPSSRFRGLTASYTYDRRQHRATLAYFGDEQEVDPGGLYALGRAGIGGDRLLVRIDHQGFPRRLLFDLFLLSLFLAVFLGKGMEAHAGLAAVVGPVGLLLGHRLLFSHKAATQPPDFALEPFQEARVALWLVPALLLFAWTAAWLLRRRYPPPDGAGAGSSVPTLRDSLTASLKGPLGWPLLGLAVAAAGCWGVSVGGDGGRQALAILPLLMAVVLLLWELVVPRWPRAATAVARIQEEGLPWQLWWAGGVGLAVFLIRLVASGVGMPETVRFPVIEFRLLWTVLQLPLAAVVAGLALYRLGRWSRQKGARGYLLGLVDLGLFLALAFGATALVVGDTGLVLAHALAPIVALLLLVMVPLRWPRPPWQRCALALLPALPLLLVLTINGKPELLVDAFGWGKESAEAGGDATAVPVRDTAAQLSSNRAQQLFRLYMLARPEGLSEVGLIASERVAVHYQTLQSYADKGGLWGGGYLAAELPRHLGITYFSDLVPMVFVLPDFGKVGLLGLALLYVALLAAVGVTLPAVPEGDRLGGQGLHIALIALLAITLPSLYMILANLNLVLFTGKNMSLLSLNSLSDVLQGGALAALAVLGLGLRRGLVPRGPAS